MTRTIISVRDEHHSKVICTIHDLMRVVAAIVLMQVVYIDAKAEGSIERSLYFDISPDTSLEDALIQWGAKVGVTVMIDTSTVERLSTKGIKGKFHARQALGLILRDSGLTYTEEGNRVRVVRLRTFVHSAAGMSEPDASVSQLVGTSYSSSDYVSPEDGATANSNTADDSEKTHKKSEMPTVVVTAEKREERLQDVPVPVTALQAASLVDNGQERLEDYYASVPGLIFQPGTAGNTAALTIRGLYSGTGNPTVSVTIDDVPTGSSSSYGGGLNSFVPDIDPSDLARVEILRGPQGTLYGASSLGGLVKYVTAEPSLEGLSGRIQTNVSTVHYGEGAGYGIRGTINVPLTDTVAVRASAFSRMDPGYIDNVQSGASGVNRLDVSGGHLAALWQPTDAFSLKLAGLLQDSKQYGYAWSTPALGNFKQNALPGTGGTEQRVQIYSATLAAKLGMVSLTAVTGYSVLSSDDALDYTTFFGSFFEPFYGAGVTATRDVDHNSLHKLTQEVRMSMPIGQWFDWLIGGFYTHESSLYRQRWIAEDPTTQSVAGMPLDGTWPTTYEESAIFTDLTVSLSDQFDIQFGGRESRNRQIYSEVDGGDYGALFLGAPGPLVTPEVTTNDSSFTYLVTPRLKFTPDLMVYARLASGYRAGGPNPACSAFSLPCHFDPDKTRNYEIGFKGTALDHMLSVDTSIYYIDWKNMQLTLLDPAGSFYGNAGRSKSEGIEWSVDIRPFDGLAISTWGNLNHAVLTEGLPARSAVYGNVGTRLPLSALVTVGSAIQEEFPIAGELRGVIGSTANYVGPRIGGFPNSPTSAQPHIPGYVRVDMHSGVKYESWSVTVVVNNVADARGVIADSGLLAGGFYLMQPRTIRLAVAKTF